MREQNKEFDAVAQGTRRGPCQGRQGKGPRDSAPPRQSQRILREQVSKHFYAAAKKSGNEEIQAELAAVSGEGPMDMAMMNLMEDSRVDPKQAADPKLMQRIKADESCSASRMRRAPRATRTTRRRCTRLGAVPPNCPRQHLAVTSCASSARATARSSRTPTTKPACHRRSR
jgi:hypothetical protein